MKVDYTQLSLFSFCPRKYWYIYKQCLEQSMGNAPIFSSELVHPAIAAWYLKEEPNWGKMWEKYTAKAPKPDDEFYSLDRAKAIHAGYITQFASDMVEYTVITAEEVMRRGLDFAKWLSKPDVVLLENLSHDHVVLDIKTSKWGVGSELLPFDRQFLGQARVTKAKWMIKCHVYMTKKGNEITRSARMVSPDLLDEWEEELEQQCRYLEMCEANGVWPKQAPGSCYAFNRLCEFAGLCEMGGLKDQAIANWKKVNPFEYLEE